MLSGKIRMISFALIFCTCLAYAHSIRSVCYFSNSGKYRPGIGTFTPEHIDPMLCTHLVYSYAQIMNLELKPTEWDDEYPTMSSGMYSKVLNHRKENTNLKVLLAVGNFMEKPESFFLAVDTPSRRFIFSKNVAKYARERTFDGVTLEWANLASKPNSRYDKAKFLLLLKAIKSAFDAEAQANGKTRLILAVTLPAKKREIDTGYMIPEIVQESDFISVRAFDMRTPEDRIVGLSSAFLPAPSARGNDMYLSVKWVANYYTSMGIPKDKINIGISTYGRTFQLQNESKYRIGDEAVDWGIRGPWTGRSYVVGHYEMCQFMWRGGKVLNAPGQGGRFYVDRFDWISYEDTLSVIQKACFIKQEEFGGITFWSLDLDDFSGKGCREGKYPLIKTALRVMSSQDMSPCSLLNSTRYVPALSANETELTAPPAVATSFEEVRVVCYYDSSSYYRREEAQFVPEDIDPSLCTHIVFSSARLNNYNIVPNSLLEMSKPWRPGLLDRFVNVRKRNSALKVLLGVISGTEKNYIYRANRQPLSTYNLRVLAKTAVAFIRRVGFDGLEFTWSQHTAEEKSFFLDIVKAFTYAIDADASTSSNPRLIFAVDVPAAKAKLDIYGLDMKTLEEAADFLSIRTHGFHGSWEDHTGFNAPLYDAYFESGENVYLNWHSVAKYYVSLGVSKSKINLGIPTYARTYTLKDEQYTGPYAAVTGSGIEGDYTGKSGLLAFYEVCDFIARGATVVRVAEMDVPYAFMGDQWVSYDDVQSVGEKACYARKFGFGGIGVWSLDTDDFVGISCGKGKYPLLTAIYNTAQNDANSNCSRFLPMPSTSGADANLQRLEVMDLNLLLLLVLAFYTSST